MCYRIIFGLVNVCGSDFFELNCASQTINCTNDVVTAVFELPTLAIRVINVWNSLPADRVDFSSFACFKHTVEQIDFTPFFSCYCDFDLI